MLALMYKQLHARDCFEWDYLRPNSTVWLFFGTHLGYEDQTEMALRNAWRRDRSPNLAATSLPQNLWGIFYCCYILIIFIWTKEESLNFPITKVLNYS